MKLLRSFGRQVKPHTIGGMLVKPTELNMAKIMLGKDAENKLALIPLSNDTIRSRIDVRAMTFQLK